MLSGLEYPTSGTIRLDGEMIEGNDSRIGMVFQKWSLLPWKTVMENVEIGPKFRGVPKKERREIAQKYIELVGLKGFENAYPSQLSGGMKQRVGIARAYTNSPEILIMDDSASALDFATDAALRHAIHEQTKGMTVFIVSQRATSIKQADKILVLDDGELAGVGTHKELMESCEVYREICLSQLSEQEVNR